VDDLAFILNPHAGSSRDAMEPGAGLGLSQATHDFQVQHIERTIRRARDNMTEAARMLGLHRSNLYRKMRQLGMHAPDEEE